MGATAQVIMTPKNTLKIVAISKVIENFERTPQIISATTIGVRASIFRDSWNKVLIVSFKETGNTISIKNPVAEQKKSKDTRNNIQNATI